MPKYFFTVEATITMTVDVIADTLEAAIKKARGRPTQSLCHQCAHGEKGAWNTSGELDADPASSPVVDAGVGDGGLDIDVVKKLWAEGQ